MLERMLEDGKEQAGIYAQSFRILDATTMFAFLFAGLLLPMFAKMLKRNESIVQLTQLSYILLIVPVISLSVACIFYSQDIMELLYQTHAFASKDIFALLMIGFIAISTTYIFGTLLTANGNLRQLNIMAASGMILNIILNLILIPKYQAFGSAIAAVITQAYTAVAQIFITVKVFKFGINIKLLSKLFLFLSLVISFAYFSKIFIPNWLIGFVCIGIFGVLTSFAVKLFQLNYIFELLKFKQKGEEV
jgi:O-antigen/teichoic acid export membrane protein